MIGATFAWLLNETLQTLQVAESSEDRDDKYQSKKICHFVSGCRASARPLTVHYRPTPIEITMFNQSTDEPLTSPTLSPSTTLRASVFLLVRRSDFRTPRSKRPRGQDPCVLMFSNRLLRLGGTPGAIPATFIFAPSRALRVNSFAAAALTCSRGASHPSRTYTVLVTSARLRKTPRRPLSAPPPSCSIARARVSRSATVVLFYYLKHPLSSNSQTDTLCLIYSGGPDSLTGTVSNFSCTFLEPRRLVVSGRLALLMVSHKR